MEVPKDVNMNTSFASVLKNDHSFKRPERKLMKSNIYVEFNSNVEKNNKKILDEYLRNRP